MKRLILALFAILSVAILATTPASGGVPDWSAATAEPAAIAPPNQYTQWYKTYNTEIYNSGIYHYDGVWSQMDFVPDLSEGNLVQHGPVWYVGAPSTIYLCTAPGSCTSTGTYSAGYMELDLQGSHLFGIQAGQLVSISISTWGAGTVVPIVDWQGNQVSGANGACGWTGNWIIFSMDGDSKLRLAPWEEAVQAYRFDPNGFGGDPAGYSIQCPGSYCWAPHVDPDTGVLCFVSGPSISEGEAYCIAPPLDGYCGGADDWYDDCCIVPLSACIGHYCGSYSCGGDDDDDDDTTDDDTTDDDTTDDDTTDDDTTDDDTADDDTTDDDTTDDDTTDDDTTDDDTTDDDTTDDDTTDDDTTDDDTTDDDDNDDDVDDDDVDDDDVDDDDVDDDDVDDDDVDVDDDDVDDDDTSDDDASDDDDDVDDDDPGDDDDGGSCGC